MKKIITTILASIIICLGFFGLPTFAAGECPDGCVATSIIGKDGCYCDGVGGILLIVFNVMTGAIGGLAVIGVIISGYQYMTSAGDPGKMTKAKSRIINIVIGLVVFAVMWAVLNFLIPGGLFNE